MEELNRILAQEQATAASASMAIFAIHSRLDFAQVDYEDPQASAMASVTLSHFRHTLRALSTNRQIFEQLENAQSQVSEDMEWAASEMDQRSGNDSFAA